MAQQGGTYRVPAGASRPISSPRTTSKEDGKSDSNQWEIVNADEADDEGHIHTNRTSTHFDIRLGFGSWKWTVFSWDSSREIVTRHPAPHEGSKKQQTPEK